MKTLVKSPCVNLYMLNLFMDVYRIFNWAKLYDPTVLTPSTFGMHTMLLRLIYVLFSYYNTVWLCT